MAKKILINKELWQTRIATTLNDKLQNIYFSEPTTQRLEHSFFKGVITKVLPGIQTAFVDIGQERAGFLHISEVDRDKAIQRIGKTTQLDDDSTEKQPPQRTKPNIKNIFKEGDITLVQVSKEPIYEKGAKLTTCFTLPGRFIVLMPNIPRIGISKKIEDRDERTRLKELVKKNLPKGMGAIIRTTSENSDDSRLIKDIKFLVSSWKNIEKKFASAEPKEKIHEDLELDLQIVRDHLDDDVEAIITDDKASERQLLHFVKKIAPEHSLSVLFYEGDQPLFEHFNIDKQAYLALQKRVNLKSGGSLIIETTEAMTVIDVNTGRFVGKSDLEETILKTNLEAATEIVRQLRLRNIGGLIVIDFIDMASSANRNKLFNSFEKTLKEYDKFQSVVLKVSEFGLVQMTRKRSGKTLVQQLTNTCNSCNGSGFKPSLQTKCHALLRSAKKQLQNQTLGKNIVLEVNPIMQSHLTTVEYNSILQIEKIFHCKIEISGLEALELDQYKLQKK